MIIYNNNILMNLIELNKRIKNEICYETINKLSDQNLLIEFKKCKSVVSKLDKIIKILNKYNINKSNDK